MNICDFGIGIIPPKLICSIGKHAQNDKIPNLPNFVVIISSLEKSDKNEQQIGIT
jgi:hypothetical protein